MCKRDTLVIEIQQLGPSTCRHWSNEAAGIFGIDQQQAASQCNSIHTDLLHQAENNPAGQQLTGCSPWILAYHALHRDCVPSR